MLMEAEVLATDDPNAVETKLIKLVEVLIRFRVCPANTAIITELPVALLISEGSTRKAPKTLPGTKTLSRVNPNDHEGTGVG